MTGHQEDLWPLRRRYSTIPNFQYYDHIRGLEDRGLFRRTGSIRTEPVAFGQSLDDYIESFHGRAAFYRELNVFDPAELATVSSRDAAFIYEMSLEAGHLPP